MKIPFVVVAAAILAGCAAHRPAAAQTKTVRGPKPDWVDSQSMEYPREQYLTGVGMADDRQSAEDRARGNISKIFSTVVTVNTNDTASESDSSSGGGSSNQFQQDISQNVQTASKHVLEGVEIAEDWQDPDTKEYYALAILDKAKGAAAIKEKIAGFDAEAKAWNDKLSAATDKLPRVKAALKLLSLLDARKHLNAELRVLDGAGIDSPIDEAAIRPVAEKAVGELNVLVGLTPAGSTEIQTGIVQGLNDFGLQATTDGSGSPDILVEGTIDTKPMLGDGSAWKWARSTVTVALKDGATNKTFQQFDLSDRESSSDYDEAVRRSQVALAKKVSSQVKDAVTSYFQNQ